MSAITWAQTTVRDVLQTWVAKSASWYINDPLFLQNLVFEWSKFSQILTKIGSNLRKFEKIG